FLVAAPHRSGQAVDRVVGDSDRLVVPVVFDDGEHGPEDLLLGDAHRVVHFGEQGGGDEPAARQLRRQGGPLAADNDPGAFLASGGEVAFDALLLASAHHGPICVAGSIGSPTRCAATAWANASMNSSLRERGTSSRVWAMQAWPLTMNAIGRSAGTTVSTSASSRMIAADLPPSSRVTRAIRSAQAAMIFLPAAELPVKATLSTS